MSAPSPPTTSEPNAAATTPQLGAETFLILLSSTLRLPSKTISLTHVYIHRFTHHLRTQSLTSPLDAHTLTLTSLSLATKALESPRRLREFLVPAYSLLHPKSPPLTFPSPLYDSLRRTLVTAELVLLRVIKFDLHLPLPESYLPKLLDAVLAPSWGGEKMSAEECEEFGVVGVEDTRLGAEVRRLCEKAAGDYRCVNYYGARAVAVACLWVVMRGMGVEGGSREWVERVGAGRVEWEDFEDAVVEVEGLGLGLGL